jgi:hypothetical protein
MADESPVTPKRGPVECPNALAASTADAAPATDNHVAFPIIAHEQERAMKVVITVNGGVIQSVLASCPMEVEILDYDNAEEKGTTEDMETQEKQYRETMKEVF